MSDCIEIESSLGSYVVEFNQFQDAYSIEGIDCCYYLIDSLVVDLHHSSIPSSANVYRLDALEQKKTLFSVANIVEWLRESGATRNSKLIVIGGGIAQDVGTMAASMYMRGIEWELVPTTLLGMVDSCIGGKSSINVGAFKNIAGNFYPPTVIKIYPSYCQTLDNKKRLEGFCEAIKIFYASDPDEFVKEFTKGKPSYWLQSDNLIELTKRSLVRKKAIIEKDEFDNGDRLLLNFGHTFGHAIESAANYFVPHGIAVGLGMILATNYVGSLDKTSNSFLLQQLIKDLFNADADIASGIKQIDPFKAAEAFESDKKHYERHYRLILPCGINDRLAIIKVEKTVQNKEKIISLFKGLGELL
jgi:3-dehydroquinate synthase